MYVSACSKFKAAITTYQVKNEDVTWETFLEESQGRHGHEDVADEGDHY